MRTALIAVMFAAATPAFAAPDATVVAPTTGGAAVARSGEMLRDANNVRLGAVDAVKADGSVGVILDGRYFVVPASTLNMVNGKLATSLSKKDLISSN